jgi:hypothetical protein
MANIPARGVCALFVVSIWLVGATVASADQRVIVKTNNFRGATLNSPETVTIQNPAAGTWTIVVNGFAVFGKDDKYEIRVEY